MNRRNFLKTGSVSVAAVALTGIATQKTEAAVSAHSVVTATDRKKQIGLQLYSLRDDMSKNSDKTLEAVAKMGYQSLESYGYNERKFFGKSPVEFKKQLTDLGMRMTSSHTNIDVYAEEDARAWDAARRNMEDTRAAGGKWIVQAGYPGVNYTSLDEVKKLSDTFNRIGELAKSYDLRFAYHNHREEFRAVENQIPYQFYLEQTDKNLVSYQMDIGHVANEMADYLTYLIHYPGRFGCLHIRDTNISTKVAIEMGEGDVRLSEVFGLFAHAGVEDYFVEQEEYNYAPLESLRRCYDYLEKADFVKW